MSLFDPPGKNILLHNPCGLRVEINLQSEGKIELWYSPKADRSSSYRDRNFSNRDDHMRLWDAITLPDVSEKDFLRCDYDPFHVTLHFTSVVFRVAISFHAPLIYLDVSEPQHVDLKSHRDNRVISCRPNQFKICHNERKQQFEFTAQSQLDGFKFQPTIEAGRSTYASLDLNPGNLLVIGGDLDGDIPKLERSINEILDAGYDRTRDGDETAIDKALRAGSFALRNQTEWEKLVYLNRRVLLAMQDNQGAIRAAMNRKYYLIWVRDGSITETFQAHSGNTEPLTRWKNFLLANATKVNEPGLSGWMFGQLTNPISKWQEDGLFYAVWTVYQHWTQTGQAPTPEEHFMLEEATDWYQNYCYDPDKKMFGRYYAGETPFKGSRDFGLDGAVGKFVTGNGVEFKGQQVRRSYDIYINILNWNVYLMLSEMATDFKKVRDWRKRAKELHTSLMPLIDKDVPDYGWVTLEDGKTELATGYGLDRSDYEWALSITPFFPTHNAGNIRKTIFEKTLQNPSGCILAGTFSQLQSIDPLDIPEEKWRTAVNLVTAKSLAPGEKSPMPYTMVEMLEKVEGDPHPDIRPQAFSIGPFLASLVGVGLRRLPHGLAIRPNRFLRKIDHYEYRGHVLQISFDDERSGLSINHEEVPHTWQIPESHLRPGKNILHFPSAAPEFPKSPTLLGSTARLTGIHPRENSVSYHFDTYGWNSFRLVVPETHQLSVHEASGSSMPFKEEKDEHSVWVHFEGSGDCILRITQD